jgi:hypothetical protein
LMLRTVGTRLLTFQHTMRMAGCSSINDAQEW